MAAVYLVTSLVYQLDDMETELRFHNFRHLLRVSKIKRDIGECRVESSTSCIAKLSTLTGRAGVFAV